MLIFGEKKSIHRKLSHLTLIRVYRPMISLICDLASLSQAILFRERRGEIFGPFIFAIWSSVCETVCGPTGRWQDDCGADARSPAGGCEVRGLARRSGGQSSNVKRAPGHAVQSQPGWADETATYALVRQVG